MEELTPWHRLFGLHWMDFLHGLPVEVEMEKDLSLKQQFLDIVIIRGERAVLPHMPDGFEGLVGAQSDYFQIVSGNARRLGP